MSVLLLRLAGPMQSWGVQSKFGVRDTGLEPSKSGVVGLLCAALGRARGEAVDDLAALRMGVRVDQEGRLLSDYHTAMDVWRARGGTKPTELSRRYYLADARFLVGLEGEDRELLAHLHAALRDPCWPLYLGRRAFVPGEPVGLEKGLWLESGLGEALAAYPWLGRDRERYPEQVRWVIEGPAGSEVRPDQPLSFAERRFAPRRLETRFAAPPPREEAPCTFHV